MRAKVIEPGCPRETVRVQHLGVQLAKIAWRPRAPDANGVTRFLALGRIMEKS